MWYCIYLVIGILHLAMSVVVITHIFSYKALKTDGKNVNAFLNRWVENIEASDY